MKCQICSKTYAKTKLYPLELVRPMIIDYALKKHPDLDPKGMICIDDLRQIRSDCIQEMLYAERGEIDSLDKEVLDSLRDYETLTENINERFEQKSTFGQKFADKIAQFGGSWAFIIIFLSTILVWMGINISEMMDEAFDPYPFILLNLVLSCLAALQAPVILMSQNRQSAKDRLRDNDEYCINLKVELELRHLQSKIDYFMKKQWERLVEIQQIQVELTEDILKGKK